MTCPTCGRANRAGARFCDDCGGALELAPDGASQRTVPLSVGDGRYHVKELLGEGARKVVYSASDTRLGRDVAVAVIKTDTLDDAGRHRIEREARAMARLGDHPNIVTVFDVGDDEGQPYIVAELMPGGSVADALQQSPDARLPLDDALRITEQVAHALAHAHNHGVVHRDVKPANVWLASDGSARLGDFGLAVETDRSRITSEGLVIGTVAYLAPEQAVGRSPDARSDLYALGAFLYEVLTGRPPFLGDDAVSVISQHLHTAPVAPSWHNAEVSAPVETLVLSLLAKDPGARPATAALVAEELARLRATQPTAADAPIATTSPPRLAALFGRFVGRSDELEAVKGMFDDSLSGRARLVMVVGEPGIGKTRLVEELGVYAAMRGAQVCWGHCYEGELGAPYLPFVEALRSYVRDRSDDELRSELSGGAPEVATLVSDVRTRFPDLPPSPPLEGDAERMRLFEGVGAFLINASASRPIVLVLDDLHWADKPTLLLMQYLARNLRRERILVVCTYRDVELDRTHPLAEMIASLRREHLYERVLLRGLDAGEVKALIDVVGEQDAPQEFADAIFRETEGNPFFVAEILRHLAESGALARVDGRWVPRDPNPRQTIADQLPEGVREVIGRRLSMLGDDCNRMLTVGAAMPGGFSLDVVAHVLGVDDDHVLDLLDVALARQVLRERRDQAGMYEFNHALIRQTLYAELSTPRRVRLHRQILNALEAEYGAHVESHLAELAYHAFQAAVGGDVDKAIDYATRAGQRASGAAAHEEAARAYDLALQALELEDEPSALVRAELLLALGDARNRAGEFESARVAFTQAAAAARELDDGNLLGRIALAYGSLRIDAQAADKSYGELIDEAMARPDLTDDTLRARLFAAGAYLVAFADTERHATLARQAIEAARRSGDALAQARANEVARLTLREDRLDAGKAAASYERTYGLAADAGEIELVTRSAGSLWSLAVTDGSRGERERWLVAMSEAASRSRSPFLLTMAKATVAADAVLEGRYSDAESEATECLALARRIGDRSTVTVIGPVLWPMLREQGRMAGMERSTRQIVDDLPTVAAWRVGLAFLLCESGRLDEASGYFEPLAADDFAMVAEDVLRPFTLCQGSDVAIALGDVDRCEVLFQKLAPRAGTAAILGTFACHGAVDRYLGRLASALGRHDEAVPRIEAGIAFDEGLGAVPFAARGRYDLGVALLRRDGEGDRDRAVHVLNDALDTANAIGMTRLVEEVLTAKLELQGVGSGSSVMASIDVVAANVSIERPDLRGHASSDGTITVVFSDIENSTPLNERLGDERMQTVLRAHDDLVRTAVSSHGGTVVKSQGDGYMIVFTDTGAAVACAVAVQRALSTRDFGDDVGVIRVRIGVHVGEVIQQGDDFFGRTVIIAARVGAHAVGGEILISEAVRSRAPDIATVTASREVELKGLSGTYQVHRIDW